VEEVREALKARITKGGMGRWPIASAITQYLLGEFGNYKGVSLTVDQYPSTQMLFAMDWNVPRVLWRYESSTKAKGHARAIDYLLQISPGSGMESFYISELVGFLKALQPEERILEARHSGLHVYPIQGGEQITAEGLVDALLMLAKRILSVLNERKKTM
jgi:hypothetical protein